MSCAIRTWRKRSSVSNDRIFSSIGGGDELAGVLRFLALGVWRGADFFGLRGGGLLFAVRDFFVVDDDRRTDMAHGVIYSRRENKEEAGLRCLPGRPGENAEAS